MASCKECQVRVASRAAGAYEYARLDLERLLVRPRLAQRIVRFRHRLDVYVEGFCRGLEDDALRLWAGFRSGVSAAALGDTKPVVIEGDYETAYAFIVSGLS